MLPTPPRLLCRCLRCRRRRLVRLLFHLFDLHRCKLRLHSLNLGLLRQHSSVRDSLLLLQLGVVEIVHSLLVAVVENAHDGLWRLQEAPGIRFDDRLEHLSRHHLVPGRARVHAVCRKVLVLDTIGALELRQNNRFSLLLIDLGEPANLWVDAEDVFSAVEALVPRGKDGGEDNRGSRGGFEAVLNESIVSLVKVGNVDVLEAVVGTSIDEEEIGFPGRYCLLGVEMDSVGGHTGIGFDVIVGHVAKALSTDEVDGIANLGELLSERATEAVVVDARLRAVATRCRCAQSHDSQRHAIGEGQFVAGALVGLALPKLGSAMTEGAIARNVCDAAAAQLARRLAVAGHVADTALESIAQRLRPLAITYGACEEQCCGGGSATQPQS